MANKIALMGVSGSGKDFTAEFLIKHFQYKRFSFSDQLKKLAHCIYPWLDVDYPPLIKEKKLDITLPTGERITKSPRDIWLHLNGLRDIERHIFIRMLSEEIDAVESDGTVTNILISDIRSTDEFEWCKSHGFAVIYIKHEKQIYQDYTIDSQIKENGAKADFTFVNKFEGIESFKEFYIKNFVEKEPSGA